MGGNPVSNQRGPEKTCVSERGWGRKKGIRRYPFNTPGYVFSQGSSEFPDSHGRAPFLTQVGPRSRDPTIGSDPASRRRGGRRRTRFLDDDTTYIRIGVHSPRAPRDASIGAPRGEGSGLLLLLRFSRNEDAEEEGEEEGAAPRPVSSIPIPIPISIPRPDPRFDAGRERVGGIRGPSAPTEGRSAPRSGPGPVRSTHRPRAWREAVQGGGNDDDYYYGLRLAGQGGGRPAALPGSRGHHPLQIRRPLRGGGKGVVGSIQERWRTCPLGP